MADFTPEILAELRANSKAGILTHRDVVIELIDALTEARNEDQGELLRQLKESRDAHEATYQQLTRAPFFHQSVLAASALGCVEDIIGKCSAGVRTITQADAKYIMGFIWPAISMINHIQAQTGKAMGRDRLGRLVRQAWIKWAHTTTTADEHPSWFVPYDNLSDSDKEADMQIGEAVAAYALGVRWPGC